MDQTALILVQGLNALALSALLLFIALGLTLVFGIMRIVNFAHGAVYMLGAFAGAWAGQWTGSFWLAIPAAALAAGALGWSFERVAFRPLYGREGTAFLLVTFGLALCLTEAIRLVWGADSRALDPPAILNGVVFLLDEPFPVYRLFLIGAGIVASGGLWLLLHRTRLGLLIRAVSQNPGMAAALGVDVARMRGAVFAIGCALAGVGGLLAVPLLTAYIGMGAAVVIDAFVVVMIGGMGSFAGTIAGSALVGFTQTYGNFYLPEIALGVTYALMIVVLLLRPGGLFGEEE